MAKRREREYVRGCDGEPLAMVCFRCDALTLLADMKKHAPSRHGISTVCNECHRQANRDAVRRRREAGQCYAWSCSAQAVKGRGGYCETHAVMNAASARKVNRRRRDKRLCYRCPEKAVRGGLCDEHADEQNVAVRGHRKRRREQGLCQEAGCLKKPERGVRCVTHNAKHNADGRARTVALVARTDDEIAADLAAILAESPDELLSCRGGHRATPDEFPQNRARKSGKGQYCRSHYGETVDYIRQAAPFLEALDEYRCYVCGAEDDLHFDHTQPVSREDEFGPGVHHGENFRLLCAFHNVSKGARTPAERWPDEHAEMWQIVARIRAAYS